MVEKKLRYSLSNVIYGGVAQEALNTLACGQLLIAYALMFGASPIVIGFLGSLEFFGWFSHFFSAYLLNKGKKVKLVSVHYSACARLFYLLSALLAFFHSSYWAVWLLLLFFSANYLIGGVAGGAFYPWMKGLIPKRILGRFFAVRYKMMMVANLVCYGFGAGVIFLFERYLPEYLIFGYSSLLIVAFFLGVYSVYTLSQVQNVELERLETESFFKKSFTVLKDKKFLGLCVLLGGINFATSFVTPFFTVFMLKRMELSMSLVVVFTILSQLMYIFSTNYWSKFIDKKGCLKTLSLSCFLYIFSLILFIGSEFHSFIFLFLAHVVLGVARLGVKLGGNNLPLLYVPSQDSSIYFSIVNLSRAMGSFVSGILAGCLLSGLEVFSIHPMVVWNVFWIVGGVFFVVMFLFSVKIKVNEGIVC